MYLLEMSFEVVCPRPYFFCLLTIFKRATVWLPMNIMNTFFMVEEVSKVAETLCMSAPSYLTSVRPDMGCLRTRQEVWCILLECNIFMRVHMILKVVIIEVVVMYLLNMTSQVVCSTPAFLLLLTISKRAAVFGAFFPPWSLL
jgi:hypothetical protein